jgi:hypothetical protein
MRGKLMFVAGAAVGFVLGSRAGRERYEELSAAAQKILASPSVQEAGGVAKAQASKLYESGRDALNNSKLADKIRTTSHNLSANGQEPLDDGVPQKLSANSF